MINMNIDTLGFIAGTVSAIVFLPQVIKTYKTKSVKDISIMMFSLATLSVILWLAYGIMLMNWPIIYTNGCVLLLSIIMLYFKIAYGKKEQNK